MSKAIAIPLELVDEIRSKAMQVAKPRSLTPGQRDSLFEKIKFLLKERNAILITHYYVDEQLPKYQRNIKGEYQRGTHFIIGTHRAQGAGFLHSQTMDWTDDSTQEGVDLDCRYSYYHSGEDSKPSTQSGSIASDRSSIRDSYHALIFR